MSRICAFSGTLVAFVVATGLLWMHRYWLLDLWASPFLDVVSPAHGPLRFSNPANRALVMSNVIVASACLLSYPIFSVEGWLLFCRLTRHEHARRLAVPFGMASAAVAASAFWLARQVPFSVIVMP